ncbi:MAG TPA: protein kinase [Gemmatimonadaceae bacterium]|nr:protein kinase [Gemmatimonadaceae bacterium]
MSERFCPRDGSALRSQNADGDLVGTVIAERYHVMKKLGEGGMGTVYLAEHVKMGRKSALKVMNPGMTQDPDAIARFNREASNASRLNHPNICAIYDFGETPDGLIYLAMEFIEGDSLTSIIEKAGALPPARAASILHQTADGLQVAHDSGIVHRDLKPDNIMIAKGRDGTDLVKVVDFGIAKAHTSDAQKVTKTGLVVGTPEYMSPEQLAGDKLDGRSDIYSLALVGFNMLTGTLPFPSTSAQESMIMRLTDNPRALREMKPDIQWPDALQTVMDKALARDVNLRYEKASEFGRDFSMAIEKMPSKALTEAHTHVMDKMRATPSSAPTQAIPSTRVAGSPERGATPVEPAPTPVAKKGHGMLIGVGGTVVAAIGIAIYIAISGPKPPAAADGGKGGAPLQKQDSPLPAADPKTKAVDAPPGGAPPKQLNRPVPPESAKSGDAGRANAGNATGNAALTPVTRDELDVLRDLANGLDVKNPDIGAARRIVSSADKLEARAQGNDLAEILFRRGYAKIVMKDHGSGCEDLRRARALATKESLRNYIDVHFDTSYDNSCPK